MSNLWLRDPLFCSAPRKSRQRPLSLSAKTPARKRGTSIPEFLTISTPYRNYPCGQRGRCHSALEPEEGIRSACRLRILMTVACSIYLPNGNASREPQAHPRDPERRDASPRAPCNWQTRPEAHIPDFSRRVPCRCRRPDSRTASGSKQIRVAKKPRFLPRFGTSTF